MTSSHLAELTISYAGHLCGGSRGSCGLIPNRKVVAVAYLDDKSLQITPELRDIVRAQGVDREFGNIVYRL